jgi:hypothetical protein
MTRFGSPYWILELILVTPTLKREYELAALNLDVNLSTNAKASYGGKEETRMHMDMALMLHRFYYALRQMRRYT